ncbi:hypothetical protein [Filifactor villosus]|uniref:ABC transporter permease n=1 Tax=Filifactor villosus TaxID=29374 RepID=A0ABV9QHV4_9FIRM
MKYIAIVLNNFYSELSFKFNLIAGILTEISSLVLGIFAWLAVYRSTGGGEIGGFDQGDMLVYLSVSHMSAILFSTGIVVQTAGYIKRGRLTTFLLRPYSFLGENLSAYLGRRSIYLIAYTLILFAFSLKKSSGGYYLLVFVALLINFLMFFTLMQGIGNLAFFITEMWPIRPLVNALYFLLGGIYFPLNFLPYNIYRFLRYNPFAMVTYQLTLAVEKKLEISELVRNISISFWWLVFFYLIYKLSFRAGLKRYEGMGA